MIIFRNCWRFLIVIVIKMEASTRKRKLNEIDKNIPFFPSSVPHPQVIQGVAEKVISKNLKPQKLITPSKGCENKLQFLSRDGEEYETSKLQKSIKKEERPTNIENRNHMKSCDRRYRKVQLSNDRLEYKVDLSVDIIPPKPLEISDISNCNLTFEPHIQGDGTYANVVTEDVTREMRMWFACEYFEDILTYEFQKEKRYKLSEDYCKKYDVDPARREILIDWLISVQMHLKAGNNTLHLAVSLLDILLDRIYIPHKLLQVSAIAAFWVAYKFIHGNLSVKTLIGLCAGVPTKDMILDHEILVLESSRLLQAGGDMSTFFNYLLFKLFGGTFPSEIYYSGQYFLEIMIIQFEFIGCSACEKAITAIYTALAIFESNLRFKLFEFTHFISKKKLKLMCCQLMGLLRNMYSDEDMLRNLCVYRKYRSSRYFKISAHEVLKGFTTSYKFEC